jgi:Tfp pilus assembly protein PilF
VKLGQLDAGISELQQALMIKPDYPLAHLILAKALAAKGNAQEARQHYEQALSLARAHGDGAMAERIKSDFSGNP